MKKLIRCIVIIAAFLLLPIQVYAVDYSIETMNIDVYLQEDGDVHVIEEQTYKFDSAFNGITRIINPKEGTSITNVAATENNDALDVEQDGLEYRIHRKGKDETITVELTYTIVDGVQVYADIAEFYWPFFDTNNVSDYEQFNITVHPPKATDDVIALGYDTAENSEKIMTDGSVVFNLGYVPSAEKGDIRVAYDKTLFPSASITKDIPMKDNIMAEQQNLIDQRIAFEQEQNNLSQISMYVIGFLLVVFILLLFIAWRKKQTIKLEVERRFPPAYFVPEETMSLPATIYFMKSGMFQSEVLTAALLELVRKGHVKQTDEASFKVVNRNTTYEHERILIEWLFDEVGQDGSFKMEDLKTYTNNESNLETYQKNYTSWQQAVQEEVNSNVLFAKNTKLRALIAMIGVFLIPFIVVLGIYELYMFMFFGIVLSIGFLLFSAFFRVRTAKGVKIKRDWETFQVKYPQMSDSEWNELIDDDQKRAFIFGFGMKDKHINRKNEDMLNRFPHINYTDPNPMFFLLFATTAHTQFQKANTAAIATSGVSGSGTTFSGGTGVGGGGGGSGAF